jgi:acyl-CoA reductase-like NAD-dependent aldehyde dehydrogenase
MSRTQQHQGMYVVPCWINGEAIPLDTSQLIEVNSSAQGKVVHYAHSATVEVATNAVETAAEAFKTFSEVAYSQRRAVLMKAAEIMESRIEELMQYQIDETSCPEPWARFNVVLAAKAIREIAANITIACTGEMPPPETGNTFCLVYKQAIGPVLSIAPWNGSIVLSSRALAAPLAAGCTVVFKASELSPRTHLGVTQAFLDAGIPGGALNHIQVDRENANRVTEAIIAHPAIRKIEFVGSAAIGRVIGQLAAKYLKPVLMELGGKCPAIVLKDADLRRAANLCVQGAIMHHGQVCMSTERIIVVEEVAEEFTKYLREAVAALHGNAGFAVSKQMAQKARKLISDATDNGASLLIGNNETRGNSGAALEPTFITGVKTGNPIHDLESFGPSATVYFVKNEKEALETANDSSYGLTGAIHTKDILKGLRMAKSLEVGLVAINDVTLWDEPSAPIGGIKGSGWGKNNSRFGVEEFLIRKAVAVVEPTAVPSFG